MEMHQVRYFLAVCRTLNFTKAAEECNVAQPSLTRAVQKLEEELGGPLFHRERANTHLTELGRLMLPHLEQTFSGAAAARRVSHELAQMKKVPLKLGIMSTIAPDEIVSLIDQMSCELGVIHYASDTPYSRRQSLLSKSLSYFGMESTYGATAAIARRIFKNEIARLSR